MPEKLFPKKFVSGSVQTQKQLDDYLRENPDFSRNFISIAVAWPKIRAWYETYWQRLYKYLDKDFVHKFRQEDNNSSCSWEFHIASTLYDHGILMREKDWEIGPDFCIQTSEGKKIWIEAISCSRGEVDPVPEKPKLEPGEIYVGGGSIEELNRPRVLRILNAVTTKHEKHIKYLKNKKSGVSKNDPFIIAVNGAEIEFASYSDMLLKRAVFGVGPDVYHKDKKSNNLTGPFYTPAPNIVKKSGDENKIIPTNFMELEEFSNVSAVLYCGRYAYNCSPDGKDFFFAYHVSPKNPVPDNFFTFGSGIRKNLKNNTVSIKEQKLK